MPMCFKCGAQKRKHTPRIFTEYQCGDPEGAPITVGASSDMAINGEFIKAGSPIRITMGQFQKLMQQQAPIWVI